MPSRIARYLQSSVSGVNLDKTQHPRAGRRDGENCLEVKV
jgi:hypothetical protein